MIRENSHIEFINHPCESNLPRLFIRLEIWYTIDRVISSRRKLLFCDFISFLLFQNTFIGNIEVRVYSFVNSYLGNYLFSRELKINYMYIVKCTVKFWRDLKFLTTPLNRKQWFNKNDYPFLTRTEAIWSPNIPVSSNTYARISGCTSHSIRLF